MKLSILILFLATTSCFAQDSIPFSNYYLTDNELLVCRGAKDQVHCLDSLIQVNLEMPKHSGSARYRTAYLNRLRKLFLYHQNAGFVSGYRGALVHSFAYFDLSEQYLDTLEQHGKVKEFEGARESIRHQKLEFCANAYRKDTAAFHRCHCMQFFPNYKDESIPADTASSPKGKQPLPLRHPNWGELYIRDTLRIHPDLVSDSASILYFKNTLQALLLSKLTQPTHDYFELLGDPGKHITTDTLIYRLSVTFTQGSYERSCKLVFTSSRHPQWFYYFPVLISNMEFPEFIRKLDVYIPLVVSTENVIRNHVSISDDHIRIEAIKLKPIDPK